MGSAPTQRNIAIALHNQHGPEEASPVMNETLSVIDEHITDMNTPRSSMLADDRRASENSASDYSNHADRRVSYIAGQETDEEEEQESYTRAEVLKWSPEDVARCLREVGVESRHCDIFKEQEISGEVLLAMDQSAIFMKEFDLGVVGRRLRTWHKIKAWQDEMKARDERQKAYSGASRIYDSSEDLGTRQVQPGMSAPQPLNLGDGSTSIQDDSPGYLCVQCNHHPHLRFHKFSGAIISQHHHNHSQHAHQTVLIAHRLHRSENLTIRDAILLQILLPRPARLNYEMAMLRR